MSQNYEGVATPCACGTALIACPDCHQPRCPRCDPLAESSYEVSNSGSEVTRLRVVRNYAFVHPEPTT